MPLIDGDDEEFRIISWIHGGQGPDGLLNDLWGFRPGITDSQEKATEIDPIEEGTEVEGIRGWWEELSVKPNSTLPPKRRGHLGAVVWRVTPDKFGPELYLYIWGGIGEDGEYLRDMWVMYIDSDFALEWEKVSQSGAIPAPRAYANGGRFSYSFEDKDDVSGSNNTNPSFYMIASHGMGSDGPLTDTFICAFEQRDYRKAHWRQVGGKIGQYNPWKPHAHMLASSFVAPDRQGYQLYIGGGCYGTRWTGGTCPSQKMWSLNLGEPGLFDKELEGNVITAKEKADALPVGSWKRHSVGPPPRFRAAMSDTLTTMGAGFGTRFLLMMYCGTQQQDGLATDQIISAGDVDCSQIHFADFAADTWRTGEIEWIGPANMRDQAFVERTGHMIAPFYPFEVNETNALLIGTPKFLVFGGRTIDGEYINETYVIEYGVTKEALKVRSGETRYWSYPEVHGIFMFMAFGLLFPLGAITARHWRKRKVWLKIHILFQSFGFLFAIIGLALVLRGRMGKVIVLPHSILGLVLISLLLLQVLVVLLTKAVKVVMHPIDYSSRVYNSTEPSAYDPAVHGTYARWRRVWSPFHRLLGWIIPTLGFTNVTLGLFLLGVPFILWMHWVVAMAVVVVVLVVFEIARVGKAARQPTEGLDASNMSDTNRQSRDSLRRSRGSLGSIECSEDSLQDVVKDV